MSNEHFVLDRLFHTRRVVHTPINSILYMQSWRAPNGRMNERHRRWSIRMRKFRFGLTTQLMGKTYTTSRSNVTNYYMFALHLVLNVLICLCFSAATTATAAADIYYSHRWIVWYYVLVWFCCAVDCRILQWYRVHNNNNIRCACRMHSHSTVIKFTFFH